MANPEQKKWLTYWAVFAFISSFDGFLASYGMFYCLLKVRVCFNTLFQYAFSDSLSALPLLFLHSRLREYFHLHRESHCSLC